MGRLSVANIGLRMPKVVQSAVEPTSLLYAAICFGVIVRTTQFLFNRSLWLDEAMLAVNIVNRSFSELLKPLDYNQGAPIGFLLAEKLLVEILGPSEYALRLYPFLAGLISILLFVRVARYFLELKALVVATALFAISYKLIFYSSNVKQYSSDVAIVLLLYMLALHVQSTELNSKKAFAIGILGAVSVWFSHPASFVLAGIATVLLVRAAYKKAWSKLLLVMKMGLFWFASFAVFYFIALQALSRDQELSEYWHFGFMPIPPTSFQDLKWFEETFVRMFRDPLGLFPATVGVVTFSIGCTCLAIERKQKWSLIAAPMLFALLASGLRVYPFNGRLLLFAVPFLLLCIAAGVERFALLSSANHNVLTAAITTLLVAPQLMYSSTIIFRPHVFEDVKPAIEHIAKRWQPGDMLYVYHGARPTFQFYSARYGLDEKPYTYGRANRHDRNALEREGEELQASKRLWILFAHVDRSNGIDDVSLFLQYLGKHRGLVESFEGIDAAAYLYSQLKPPEVLVGGVMP